MTHKPPSQRQLRVGEEIRHILADIFRREMIYDEQRNEINTTVVSVSEVRISPDLKNATAYITVLGGQGGEEMVAKLNKVAPTIRNLVTRKLNLKFSTKIHFRLDTSFETAERIEALLRRPDVARDLEKKEDE